MYKLSNGVEIPKIGYGTWKITDKEQCREVVRKALELGYRHIDTATIYTNEDAVGEGIADFLSQNPSVKREDIFVTTKVWNSDQGYESTLKAFENSMKDLKLDYLDLYLVHWPQPKELEKTWETWRALETLYKEGKVRAIGVCNFKEHHLQHIIDNFEVAPMINQVELHPNLQQPELRAFCEKHNIIVEPWSPLMQGGLENPTLMEIASRYNKSVAQVVLKWHLQHGLLPLPKSVTPSRMEQNLNLDFELAAEDMAIIDGMDKADRLGPDPDEIDF